MRILVVDDDPMVQILLQQFLIAEGHQVHIVSNGCEALDALQHAPYDLVLTDVHMPYMSGDLLVECIHKNGITVPIVVMDSYPDAFLETTPTDQVCAVLAKPFDLDAIRQILHRLGTVPIRR